MLQRPSATTRTLIHRGLGFSASLLSASLLSASLLSAGLVPAHAADPTGDWRVEDGVADIRVAECNGSMWGVVSWEKTPGGLDKNNPDASKRSRPTLGIVTLFDMKKKPNADEWNGKVYDARDSGKLYSASIRPKGANELEIEGCLVWPLCGSQTWTRVAPPIPSSPSNLANSLAKGAAKGAIANAPAPKMTSGAPTPKAPVAAPGTQKMAGQRTAPGQQADAVGDICLIPDIARLAH